MVMGRTEVEHLDNLKHVFQRLREHGIRMKHSKCTFLKTSVQYLGHRIDAGGHHATDDKVRAITEALKNVWCVNRAGKRCQWFHFIYGFGQ